MTTSQQTPSIFELQIPDVDFVVCDVETTGLNPTHHRLTEVALVKVVEGKIVDRFHSLINPQQFIPAEITAFTGITNEMVYSAPKAHQVMPLVKKFIGESIFVGHNVKFDRGFIDASLNRSECESLSCPNLCTCRLARRIYPKLKSKSLGSVAAHVGVRIQRRHRAAGDAEATARLLLHFLSVLSEEFDLTGVADLLHFQNKPVFRVTAPPTNVSHLKETLVHLPPEPGVYFFYNKKGKVIYVGKAKNLKDRISSYFYHNVGHTKKVTELVRNIHQLSYEQTETELSALLAELKYIKWHQPRFNSAMKRDRKFPFIRIDIADEYSTISWCYDIEEDGAEYFGPFSGRYAVEMALNTINRLFLLRECDGSLKPSAHTSPCLYYDIKRCGAPCAEMQSKKDYSEEVNRVKQFLYGQHEEMLAGLHEQMEMHARDLRFEDAAGVRDRLEGLKKIIRQQQTMLTPIQHQNLIIITPAKRTNVEVHFIKGGKLAQRFLINRQSINRQELRLAVRTIFFTDQKELFEVASGVVHEMRIIAAWCLAHRETSSFLPIDSHDAEKTVFQKLIFGITSSSGSNEDQALNIQHSAQRQFQD